MACRCFSVHQTLSSGVFRVLFGTGSLDGADQEFIIGPNAWRTTTAKRFKVLGFRASCDTFDAHRRCLSLAR
jgi:hypothetical protein